ncbi:signal peptidase I [Pseudoalteromonas pernae]|uniref:signal peptidase I n=1 Tax=Pseudoalteromonas pernae TaxID=3118054 RepID=UPI003242B113
MTPSISKLLCNLNTIIKNNWGLLLTITCILTIRSSFADWYTVPSGSMLPTIEIGDRVTVNKMAYDLRVPFSDLVIARMEEPSRGDIVVFESNAAHERLIKRIVGLPGDTIAMRNEVLYINGQPQKYLITKETDSEVLFTEYLGELQHTIRIDKARPSTHGNLTSVTIPDDYYLVMGDNRRNSADSRFYGLVPRAELRGKADRVAFSLDYDNYYLPKRERFALNLY